MNIYPDTTFFIALRFFDDTHHESFDGDQNALAETAGLEVSCPG